MKILGLQKMTLLDYPGKVACTVFTAGCSFRCPFCHNAALVLPPWSEDEFIDEDEVFAFLKKRVGVLDGVCISGGEPLLQNDIDEFLSKIKNLGYSVKLDTNGYNPAELKMLVFNGLVDFVAMDIKSSKERYARVAGLASLEIAKIEESVNFLKSGAVDHEFRTTVARELHSKEDFAGIANWLEGDDKYYLQGFVDSGNVIASGLSAYTKEEMNELLDIVRTKVPNAQLRGLD